MNKSIAWCCLAINVSFLNAQTDTICLQQQHVIRNLESFHINAPSITAATVASAVDQFIRLADERNIFILKPERDELQNLCEGKNAVDASCAVLKRYAEIMRVRVPVVDSIIAVLEKAPVPVTGNDTVFFMKRHANRDLCSTLSQLSARISRRMKYEVLSELAGKPEGKEDAIALAEKAKRRSLNRLRKMIVPARSERLLRRHLADCMSNALAMTCDPHSNFFNPAEMHDFNSSLSATESSFGLLAGDDDEGNVIVDELQPGGPAWKSNALNEDDVIISFRLDNEKTTELADTDAGQFNRTLKSTAAKTLELTVRKADMQLKSVSLTREKMQSLENLMSSYVISHAGKRFGYIPIPSFYSDRENDRGLGCANDVAKEIIELKQDTIEGVILDLRYNGGGSLREAMDLAGIFIEEGPLAIYRERVRRPYILKDMNRGSIWDGPLIVLVNAASASASEFVTATLQDYNRAVIAGGTTFGKGTAQHLLITDSGSFLRSRGEPPYGFMKITTGRFYRLSRASHQGVGIAPDVHLPSILERTVQKEGDYPNALKGDSIAKKVIFSPYEKLPYTELRTRSEARIRSSPKFAAIRQVGDSLHGAGQSGLFLPLNIQSFRQYRKKQDELNVRIEDLYSAAGTGLEVRNNSANERFLNIDQLKRSVTDRVLSTIRKDLLLQETVNIMHDLIELRGK